MLIYCPKCFTGYQIDEELISDKSRKVKCSSCGEVFDAGNLVAKAVDNSVNADVADTMEDITEEDAFEALAAMMREADLDDSSVLPVDKGLDEEKVVDDVVDPKDEVQQDLPNDSVVNHEVVAAEESFTIDEYNDIDQINELEHAQEQSLPKEDEILEINSVAEIEEKIFISDDIEKDTKLEEAPIAEEKTEEVVSVVVEDKKNTDDNNNDEINIDNIYERLSEHTSHLIERENKLPVYEKAWLKIKETLGFHVKIKWSYVFIGVFVFVGLSLFNNRYEVVRKVPFMNGLYKAFGIKAKIAGEGLEFQNVTWDYVIDNGMKKMEVKGFISNIADDVIDIPTVHIEVLDEKTGLLQSLNREISEKKLSAGSRASLQVVIENLPPTAKYIYLTFIDKQ